MPEAKKKYIELSDEKRAEIRRAQALIKEEQSEWAKRLRLATEAAKENTFSGELRLAIHASGFNVIHIANQVGTTPVVVDEFLTGERTLRSDTIDRLAALLGYELRLKEAANGHATGVSKSA